MSGQMDLCVSLMEQCVGSDESVCRVGWISVSGWMDLCVGLTELCVGSDGSVCRVG